SPPATQSSIVQIDEKTTDRLVEGRKREETAIPQSCQNPSTDNLHSHFDFSFIPRMIRDAPPPNPAADGHRRANPMVADKAGSRAGHRHPAPAAKARSGQRGAYGSGTC